MMSSTEDCLNSDLIDEKALETLIIASVRTLKQGIKKCGTEEVSKLELLKTLNYIIVESGLPKMTAQSINI